MEILLTNDDGIHAPGLAAMHRELTSLGNVHVVAPATVQSATSHGITLSAPLLTSKINVHGAFEGIAVEGRPADCVKLAMHLLPHKPDLVVSGINSGANLGINVIYSGTIAAAIEAAFLGLPAIAFSLHLRKEIPPDYSTAAARSLGLIRKIQAAGLKPGQVLSVNLPSLPPGQSPAGIKIVRQCIRPWPDTFERRTDPRGRDYFWASTAFSLRAADRDTDVEALMENYVTVTPLQFDLTDEKELARWQSVNLKDSF